MDKESFINYYSSDKFKDAGIDMPVIKFIADIIYHNSDKNSSDDSISNLFLNGYCYYFAVILKNAFHRGEICWHRNYGHIVWRDGNGIAYDAQGVFTEAADEDILPIESSLEDMVVDFMHNGEEYKSGSKEFSDWASHYDMTDVYAIGNIYRNMPKEEYDDSISVAENALLYWAKNKNELSYKYSHGKDGK